MIKNSFSGIKILKPIIKKKLGKTKKQKSFFAVFEKQIEIVERDNYNIIFNVNGSEVHFIKKRFLNVDKSPFECFNKDCCGFRGGSNSSIDCYHKIAVTEYLNRNLWLLRNKDEKKR